MHIAILSGLTESEFVKVMFALRQGDDKVKKAKIQTHKRQFESLMINDEENGVAYFLHVDEIANTIRGFGEKIEDKVILQKVLRSLPMRFNAKVSAMGKTKDLDTLKMNELHGILIAYKISTENGTT